MNWLIFKLKFKGFTHFGETGIDLENISEWVGADTLFSAWLNAVQTFLGIQKVEEICQSFLNGKPSFRISSLFIYHKDIYFLPRPLSVSLKNEVAEALASYLKDFKKIKWISHVNYGLWLRNDLSVEDIKSTYETQEKEYFTAFKKIIRPHVALDRETMESNLYHVGYLKFKKDAGLWGIVTGTKEGLKLFETGLFFLGEMGLGGEKTYGCGQFEAEFVEPDDHFQELLFGDFPRRVLISRYMPTPSEVSGLLKSLEAYRLGISRGWVTSGRIGFPIKRKAVRYLCEGSTFTSPVSGQLVDVTPEYFYPKRLSHKVYRYGLAFLLPMQEYSE
ncbi:type III-A CRISPR-associated RAMP protein Csm4 [Thermodesulfatator autotrophicus]|uniref:CRISPR system Cms protein Csm4 n=1 Tax=Thermodesulfatator autotrophicus TaxID=1795632 RepID=A0A177E4I9_9BACT|nr:type III-A CRISPR-associated RAMP protein Csm4 [Thermodesulfatator autotrophicus]OAG26708.1 hypothetical protein TH606_10890 [Thermodesulfatator autotrophicus]